MSKDNKKNAKRVKHAKIKKTVKIREEVLEVKEEDYLEDVVKKTSKKKKIFLLIVLLVVFVVSILAIIFFNTSKIDFFNSNIKQIKLLSYDKYNNKMTVEVTITNSFNSEKTACYFGAINSKNFVSTSVINNKCTTELDISDYYVLLKVSKDFVTDKYLLSKKINNVLEFTPKEEKTYLAVGDTYETSVDMLVIGEKPSLKFETSDSSIATVNEFGIVTGVKDGSVIITITDKYNNKVSFNVVVTSLINKAKLNNKKPFIPCKKYSEKQANLLDEILFYKVNKAGKKTRAGVVAAARFLTLEFPYRINYFTENGRLNPTTSTSPYADGEGRFYHEGLYLSTSKYKTLKKVAAGPAMWGCRMQELSFDEPSFRANGLDCSGFVTWALKNGGYDFGDLGSLGWVRDNVKDLTWLGDYERITVDLLKSGKVKAGDIVSVPGHVALLVGIDDTYVYVAEEFYYNVGLTIIKLTHSEFANSGQFTHVVLMDKAYEKDGNYKRMW